MDNGSAAWQAIEDPRLFLCLDHLQHIGLSFSCLWRHGYKMTATSLVTVSYLKLAKRASVYQHVFLSYILWAGNQKSSDSEFSEPGPGHVPLRKETQEEEDDFLVTEVGIVVPHGKGACILETQISVFKSQLCLLRRVCTWVAASKTGIMILLCLVLARVGGNTYKTCNIIFGNFVLFYFKL